MKTYSIRASVRVDSRIKDRDTWAVDLIEGSNLSDELKAGWFWATWPDRVELVFPVRADERSIEQYAKEVALVLAGAANVVSNPQLTVEEKSANEA
jgi:hypothetical protein